MPTFRKEFDDFIAYRIGDIDASYREIRELYRSLPAKEGEVASMIESLASTRAYKIGFHDALRLMAGA